MLDQLFSKRGAARVHETIGLVKRVFNAFELRSTLIILVIYEAITQMLLLGGIALLFFGHAIGAVLVALGFFARAGSFYFYAQRRSALSAAAYARIRGSQAEPVNESFFLIGIIDWVVAVVRVKSRKLGGMGRAMINLLSSSLTDVAELLSNFLIPAVVIEQKGPMQVAEQLKRLKGKAIGFDAFGSVARWTVIGTFVLLLIVGVITPILLFGMGAVALTSTLISIGVFAIVTAIASQASISAKVAYFTLYYVSLTRPQEVKRPELLELLPGKEDQRYETPDGERTPAEGYQPPKQSATPVDAPAHTPNPRLLKAVELMRQRGGTDEQIMQFLLQKGFSQKHVQEAIDFSK